MRVPGQMSKNDLDLLYSQIFMHSAGQLYIHTNLRPISLYQQFFMFDLANGHHSNDFDSTRVPNLHIKFQDHRSFGFGEKTFKNFYHIQAWRPSLSCDLNHLYKF